MSSSLPRLRTVQQASKHQSQHNPPALKFRKLTLDHQQNGEQGKKSVKALKTQRLKSLERYSTVQEQRDYKNEKIHLNLIERKLLNGTYDEKKETGNQLNSVKHKRDHMKVEINLKSRQIERYKFMLKDVKGEIQEILSHKGEHEKKIQQLKDKWAEQSQKTQSAKQNQVVFEEMFKIRHDINLNLCKRHNDLKQQFGHIKSTMSLIDTQLRQLGERCSQRQFNMNQLLKKIIKDRNERNEHISKHQNKINKRKEDEVFHQQKSKQYISQLDELQRETEVRQFYTQHKKILYNIFIRKYLQESFVKLNNHYEAYQYSFKKLCTYRTFDQNIPSQLVERFFSHEVQRQNSQKMIQERESILNQVETQNEILKKQFQTIQIDLMQNSQKLQNSLNQLNSEDRRQQIETLKQEAEEAQMKSNKIKRSLLRMLNILNQRGDKRLSGHQPSINNMNQISSILVELLKKAE